ncbi:MAG: SH3 domain-containing protein [Candidatus Magasanikbacteria bacterium]
MSRNKKINIYLGGGIIFLVLFFLIMNKFFFSKDVLNLEKEQNQDVMFSEKQEQFPQDLDAYNNYLESKPLESNQYREKAEDLNGDGKKENISIEFKQINYSYVAILHIDDMGTTTPGNVPAGYFGIVDIDKSDKLKEIAVTDEGPSSDYATTFYQYDGKNLKSLGTIQGIYENMLFDGKGKLTTQTRGSILDTWFFADDYSLSTNNILVNIPKDFYARDTEVTLLQALALKRSPQDDSTIITTLQKDEIVKIIACDNKKWCQIEKKDGLKGWFAVKDYATMVDFAEVVYATEVFEGLSNAD